MTAIPGPGLAAAWGCLRSQEAAALDAAALGAGVDLLSLMEVAGLQVARAAWARLGGRPGAVLVVAGRGNNGGDGLVAARLLDSWGCAVRCMVAAQSEARLGDAVSRQLAALRGLGIEAVVDDDAARVGARSADADLVVDALLGTGLRSAPRPRDAAVLLALRAGGTVLAVDVPSGLDASTGAAPGACVTAALTVTLAAVKAGLWEPEGRRRAGELWVADIGMPAAAWRRAGMEQPTAVRGGELLRVPAITP